MHCPLTASQQNEGSSQASKGVTWYLVSEHLTYASPKCCLHPKSTTLASGEPGRIGKCCEMTWSHLRTLPGVFLVNIIFCILLVKLVYISVHAQHVWKRMTLGQWAQQETCDGFFAFFYWLESSSCESIFTLILPEIRIWLLSCGRFNAVIRILINFKSLKDCFFGIIQVIRNNKCIYCR